MINTRTIISVAIGKQYEKEVQRLKEAISELLVITSENPNYEKFCEDALVNGLATKTAFGKFLPTDTNGPVFYCDADLYSVNGENHIDSFVEPDADIAMVRYSGTYHYPAGGRRDIYEATGVNYNSGFIWFKNHDIAREISAEWLETYKQRMGLYGTLRTDSINEYDEPAMMEVLSTGKWSHTTLDLKWNNWYDSKKDDDLFRQDHLDGFDSYSSSFIANQ